MSTEHQITKKATDGNLTIEDLRDFIAEFDKAVGTDFGPPSGRTWAQPKAAVRFGGGLKSITVTIPGEAGQQ